MTRNGLFFINDSGSNMTDELELFWRVLKGNVNNKECGRSRLILYSFLSLRNLKACNPGETMIPLYVMNGRVKKDNNKNKKQLE